MTKGSGSKKVFYLTFSYYPSGVFRSQIIDVVKLLRELSDKEVRLVSFFSLRVYLKCRKWVKKEMPDAIILPILFGMKRWEWHSKLLGFFMKKTDLIIGRNPMGAKVGLNFSPNVVFDGRSALKGEIKEYNMAQNGGLDQSFIEAEEYVVEHARHRLAVSTELVRFWKDEFGYDGNNHTIIPCSLAYSHNRDISTRAANGRIRLLFSGGGSPWQTQETKHNWIRKLLDERPDVEFVFLSKKDVFMEELLSQYPDRVQCMWLAPERVFDELCKADYGILLREDNLTNRVSSPVKFAEYLNAGLNVIISSCIKDFAGFVLENNCGIVMEEPHTALDLRAVSHTDRLRNRALAEKHFSKNASSIRNGYQQILDLVE